MIAFRLMIGIGSHDGLKDTVDNTKLSVKVDCARIGCEMFDILLLIFNVIFWILVMPVIVLELWLTKRRARMYQDTLKQIADMPQDAAGKGQARNMARQLIYDWKW